MKTRLHQWLGRSVLNLCPPILALPWLLATLSVRADTSFTSTGWLHSTPLPGIMCTNGYHQVYLKGNSHVVRLLSSDPRTTGRMEAWMDLAYQPDGTATFSGPAYVEVGTWDASGMNFAPSGGVWCVNYSGTTQSDGSSQYTMAGYGIGGNIEGLRFTAAATRAAPGSPAEPYVGSGVIKPAPVNTRAVVDDFSNGVPWSLGGGGLATYRAIETNGVFTIVGDWRGHPTVGLWETTAWAGMYTNWSVLDGQTLEARADLMNMSESASGVCVTLYHAPGQGYGFAKATDEVVLWKHDSTLAALAVTNIITASTNVLLALSISPSGQNVELTGKVLDKETGDVLCQIRCVDTPEADPTVSQPWADWGTDSPGAPWKNGNSADLFVYQFTDGSQPPATATFDNLEFLKYEIPRVVIEPAVRLTFFAPASENFVLESAVTPEGPWLPLNVPITDAEVPGMKQATVSTSLSAQFFRLLFGP